MPDEYQLLGAQIRATPIRDRLITCRDLIANLSAGRGLRMSQPVEPTDDDLVLRVTLEDAFRDLGFGAMPPHKFTEEEPNNDQS